VSGLCEGLEFDRGHASEGVSASATGSASAASAHSKRVDDSSHATQEDFAIVGYDHIDFAAAGAVPLSSVRRPRDDLGPRAELLREEAEPELVVRESSMVRRKRKGAA
jgi:DNA-binding LacI/PurR family transcriptional regulator